MVPWDFAGLYSEGILKPDEFGRVNSQHLKEAMVEVGSTVPNATSVQGQKSRVKSADICTAKAYLKAIQSNSKIIKHNHKWRIAYNN
jgi:tellurite resistance protein